VIKKRLHGSLKQMTIHASTSSIVIVISLSSISATFWRLFSSAWRQNLYAQYSIITILM